MPSVNGINNLSSIMPAMTPSSEKSSPSRGQVAAPPEAAIGKAAEYHPSGIVLPTEESGQGKDNGRPASETKEKQTAGDKTGSKAENAKTEEVAGGEPWRRGKSAEEQNKIERQITELKNGEARVKTHEQAHKATGGQYAGGISYEKSTGPDGKQYIVGGEVPIDISEENTPQKTINKMQIVRRAALAPADPSSQDRSVAASASAKEASARAELAKEVSGVSKSGKADKKNDIANVGGIKPLTPSELIKGQPIGGKTFKDINAKAQEPWKGSVVDISA